MKFARLDVSWEGDLDMWHISQSSNAYLPAGQPLCRKLFAMESSKWAIATLACHINQLCNPTAVRVPGLQGAVRVWAQQEKWAPAPDSNPTQWLLLGTNLQEPPPIFNGKNCAYYRFCFISMDWFIQVKSQRESMVIARVSCKFSLQPSLGLHQSSEWLCPIATERPSPRSAS